MRRKGLSALGLGLVLVALAMASTASAASTLGQSEMPSGGTSCAGNRTLIQTTSASVPYAAPYDGVLTSWSTSGPWSTMTFKVARLGNGGTFSVLAGDGPRAPVVGQLNTYPIRIPVRQGDVIGLFSPSSPSSCGTGDGSFSARAGEAASGETTVFDETGKPGNLAVSAVIERDADGDGFGDESQDACPTNSATAGPCPLPTTLGDTFLPVPTPISGDAVKTGALGVVVAAPADGVITSWSYQAGPLVEGTVKLKMFRPLGGSDYRAVGADQPRTANAGALNTFATRIPVRQGDKIGIHAENMPVSSNVSSPQNSYASFNGDLAAGSAATFTPSSSVGRRTDVSAVLEADADGDGYGDTSQDACPTDPATAGPCFLAPPPSATPNTKLTKKPKAEVKTKKATATVKLRFASVPAGAGFQCKLDKGKFKPCSSPKTYRLPPGRHKVAVRAVRGGLVDPTPAQTAFKVLKLRG